MSPEPAEGASPFPQETCEVCGLTGGPFFIANHVYNRHPETQVWEPWPGYLPDPEETP